MDSYPSRLFMSVCELSIKHQDFFVVLSSCHLERILSTRKRMSALTFVIISEIIFSEILRAGFKILRMNLWFFDHFRYYQVALFSLFGK